MLHRRRRWAITSVSLIAGSNMAQGTKSSETTMGRRLASLRALRGWTQTEAAQQAGISQGYLSALENDDGTERTPLSTIQRLADLYEVSLDYLVRGISTHGHTAPAGAR